MLPLTKITNKHLPAYYRANHRLVRREPGVGRAGAQRRQNAQSPAEQESLRGVQHGIICTGYRGIQIPVGYKTPRCGKTPVSFGE